MKITDCRGARRPAHAHKGMFGKLQQRITRENAERRQALKDENAEKEVIA